MPKITMKLEMFNGAYLSTSLENSLFIRIIEYVKKF